MLKTKLINLFFILGIFFTFASSALAWTVLTDYKYAWSNNVGYINLSNVIIGDSVLSGYAWSKNSGWINFNPTNGGVFNDGEGNLSGSAWGEQLGWINFDNVSINTSTGRFSGTASGTMIGVLTFDCQTYCDVRTDWVPGSSPTCTSWVYSDWGSCLSGQQTRTILTSSPASCNGGSPVLSQSCSSNTGGRRSGGSGGSFTPIIPTHIDSYNQDLTILPEQSGTYVLDTAVGKITVDIPSANVSSKTTFYINEESLSQTNGNLVSVGAELVNGFFYNVYAKDQLGAYLHYFDSPIIITLPVANLQRLTNPAIYWLNETNKEWVLIPEALFSNNQVIFKVNHLTKFAIFTDSKDVGQIEEGDEIVISKIKQSLPIIPEKEPDASTLLTKKHKTFVENITDFIASTGLRLLGEDKKVDVSGHQNISSSTSHLITQASTTTTKDSAPKSIYWWFLPILFIILGWVFRSFHVSLLP